MSAASRTALVPLVLLIAAAPVRPATPAVPSPEQIGRLIAQLGDDDFATREKATRQLWEAGKAAEPALTRALHSEDPEVKRRAGDVLEKFRWGLYPDTPPDVVALIERYQAGDRNAKQAVVKDLLDKGGKGCAVLLKIATAETNEEVRRELFTQIGQDTARAFPGLLAENDFGALEDLLELRLTVEHDDTAYQDYAAYWLLRGKLDERIGRLRAALGKGKDGPTYEALAYLCRARGDLPGARQAAEKAGRQDLADEVLAAQGNWKALAKRADQRAGMGTVEALGFRAAYHRLAGDTAGLDQVVADLRKQAEGAEPEAVWLVAKALFLNDRPDDALAVLRKSKARGALFEILCARLEFPEALALADKAAADGGADRQALEVMKARTLYLLGEKSRAESAFVRFREEIRHGRTDSWLEDFVRAEYRLGLTTAALDDAGTLLAHTPAEGQQERILGQLFPQRGPRAAAWWRLLRRRFAKEAPPTVMKRLRDLMDGQTTGRELERLVSDAEPVVRQLRTDDQEQALLVLAETALDAGLEAAGKDLLQKAAAAGSAEALVRLGDFLAGKKLWEQAAARYGQAWEKERKQPLPLFLQGWALLQGGAAGEGHKRMDLAHWLPLGDETARQEFAAALDKRGRADDARRERDLLFAVCKPGSFAAGEALREVAADAIGRKDYLKAAACQDRALLRCLRPDIQFVDNSAYVTVPAYVHRLRARGLLAAGLEDEARREVQTCVALQPATVEMPIQLLPALEKQGLGREADDLFRRTAAVQERVCTAYPSSAWAHNNLAWLEARVRRNLDEALRHARKAVALAPDQTGYLDTLAEVQFQRGDRAAAVELMKKCLARDGKNAYYRKQLERFEAGDRNRDVPDAGSDD
ncbi:MAG TPA: HEAT repeat domain-containing protein [Gemmataceae bacterium]|nr:HEAT repeat domain-containing protein [Gemmataceae bacterium]